MIDPNMLDTEPRRICLVCGRVLDYQEGHGYRHSIASTDLNELDHPAIPVSVEEASEQLRERCDFCYADETTFVVPARTFEMPNAPSVSVGDWAACELCGREIQKDAWNALFRRMKVSWVARHGEMDPLLEANLKQMYRKLRKNITGAIYREQPKP